MWEVKSHLLSNQPFKSHPIHANNPSDTFHQVLGDITAFHKAVVTFTLVLTLSLRYTTEIVIGTDTAIMDTLCLPAQGQSSFSSRIYFKWQQAYLTMCVYLVMN